MKTRIILIPALVSLVLGHAACQSADANDSNKRALDTLAERIDAMDKKLDRMHSSLARSKEPPRKRPTVGQLYNVAVSDDDAYRGSEHAKVTIVTASEFACPYCKLLASAVDPLLGEYQEGELKIVSKQFVVHPSTATEPALAACAAAKQGKFGEYERALWKAAWTDDERPRMNRDGLAVESLLAIASEIGLDTKRFEHDRTSSCKETIARNRKEMAALGVNATPAIYINGRFYGGPRTTDALKQAIDEELAAANASLANGGALQGYYERLVSKGKTSL